MTDRAESNVRTRHDSLKPRHFYAKAGDTKIMIREVTEYTAERFEADYKGHNVLCWLDLDDFERDDNRFYMIVRDNESGVNACDGWVPEDDADDIDDAILYAILGAWLHFPVRERRKRIMDLTS